MITETNYTNWELFYQLKNIDVFDIIKNQCDKIERLKALEYLDSQIDTFVYHYEKTAFYTDLIAKLQHLKSKIELSSKAEKPIEPEQNKNIKLATLKKGKLHISNKHQTYFIIALKEKYFIEVSKLNDVLRKKDGTKLSESSFKRTSQNYNVKPESYKTVSNYIESNKSEILDLFE